MLQDPNVERVIKRYTEPLKKQISVMQIELLELKKIVNYNRCCKSDSDKLSNTTLEQAIAKAKPNLDKIKDVDKHLEDIR